LLYRYSIMSLSSVPSLSPYLFFFSRRSILGIFYLSPAVTFSIFLFYSFLPLPTYFIFFFSHLNRSIYCNTHPKYVELNNQLRSIDTRRYHVDRETFSTHNELENLQLNHTYSYLVTNALWLLHMYIFEHIYL
jgi:hypothetical protein